MSEEPRVTKDLNTRTLELFSRADETMETIFAHVANGGSVIDLCRTWDLRYSDVAHWLYSDPVRKKRYEDALQAQTAWAVQRILDELRDIGLADPRKAFDDKGNLLNMKDMPREVANVIQAVECVEEFEGKGKDREQIGWTKKIKFWDKMRALELLGKQLKLFTDRVEHSGKVTLEDLVNQSIPSKDEKAGPLGLSAPTKVIEVKPEPIPEGEQDL